MIKPGDNIKFIYKEQVVNGHVLSLIPSKNGYDCIYYVGIGRLVYVTIHQKDVIEAETADGQKLLFV